MEYDVIVIGAGVMGCAAAYELSKAGSKILLLDQFKIRNNSNSSNDFSRTFRYEYGNDEFYTKLAVESLRLWKKLEKESGKRLYFRCGLLNFAQNKNDYAMKGYKTLSKLGHKVKMFNKKELKKKFPQFSAKFGVLDYNAGILEAYSAVEAFAELAKKNGVEILENTKVEKIHGNEIILSNGRAINFKKAIVTCGAWASKLLKIPIKVTKQQIVYFRPNKTSNFTKNACPIFAYLDEGFYGFPIHGINAVKVSNHFAGKIVNPDSKGMKVSKKFVDSCRSFFKRFIPGLTNAKVIKTKICFYDIAPDGDFIIGRHGKNIVIGAGFSGHGFKFAPLIGKILSDLTLKGRTSYDIYRFRLDRF